MKNLFKRTFTVFISVLLIFCLASCEGKKDPNVSATVNAQYESMLDRQFSEYTDLVINEEGSNIVIFADTEVKNVKVYAAEIDPETSEVKLGSMLMDTPAVISAEKALRIKVLIPEIIPTTVVSYDDINGTTKLFALAESGKDGSVIKLNIADGKLV